MTIRYSTTIALEGTPKTVLGYNESGDLTTIDIDTISSPGTLVISNPPENCLRVTNIYVNSLTGKTVIEYDDEVSSDSGVITSNPPPGHFRILSLHVDPNTNRTVVVYDNTPQP